MKKTTKILALIMAGAMMIGMCACGSSEEPADDNANAENPIHECTYEEMMEATGIDISAPDESEDVVYSYIDAAEKDGYPIAQVEFTCGDKEYCYRAQSTNVTSMTADVEGNEVDPSKLLESLQDCTNAGATLGGMYCKWDAGATIDIDGRDGVVAFNEGKEGMIAWLDVVPGIMYSLTTEENANQQDLMAMAEMLFVPMQGEADGE